MKAWSVDVSGQSSSARTMVDRRLEDLSRSEVAMIAGTGLVLPCKENILEAAMEFARAIVMLAAAHCMVLWIGNYKWRHGRIVCRKRDISNMQHVLLHALCRILKAGSHL